MSVNKVFILGHLGADPDLRYTANGQAVCTFNVATSEQWTDKSGQRSEHTEWHRIVVWGKQADNCKRYLAKGRQVHIEGKLKTRQWTDKDDVTRYITEVIAESVQFLGGKPASVVAPDASGSSDDDIPF